MPESVNYRTYTGFQALPERLWTGTILARDDSGFSVLSADRFRGPRRSGPSTAHDYWELVVVLGGAGELVSAAPQSLSRSDVVLIPPGVAHNEVAPDMLDTVWVALRSDRLRRGGGIQSVRDDELCRLGEELWMQAAVRAEHSGGELDGLALTLLGRFLRRISDGSASPSGDLVDQAVRWLHQHLDRQVRIADLAAHLHISEPHLHRLFKGRTKRSPMAFLNSLRIERAAHLLRHTALTSARIATLTGFDDPLYFSKAFTRAIGTSPSRFRAG